MRIVVAVLFVIGSVSLVACGPDEEEEDEFEFTSDVSSSKSIGEMDEDDHEEFCRDSVDYINNTWGSSIDAFCTAGAHGAIADSELAPSDDEQLRELCKQGKSQCKQEFDGEDVVEGDCSGSAAEDVECDVELSVAENCITEFTDRFRNAVEGVPACGDVEAEYYEDYEDPLESIEEPETCKTIEEECPGFGVNIFGGEAGGGGGSGSGSDDCPDTTVEYDQNGDGELETYCTVACESDTDCSLEDRECVQGYCLPPAENSG